MAHQAHVRHPSTSTHAPPPTTLHLTFTSADPYNTTLVPSSPTATTVIAQSHSPSALSFSSSALADTPTPLPIHNGNGDGSDEGGIWDGEARVGDSISIRVESPISESSAPGTSPLSSRSGSQSGSGSRGRSQSGSIRTHPHLTTTVAGSGIISASGSLMFAPTSRGGPGPGGVGVGLGGTRTNTPVVRLGQRPRSSSGERSGGTSEVERPEALYVVVSPASSGLNQNQFGHRDRPPRQRRRHEETVIHGGGPGGEVVAKIMWRRFRRPEVVLLGPSMPHGRAKVVVEGWVSRMRRKIRERTRMRGRARAAVGDGRGSSPRRVQEDFCRRRRQ